MNRPGCRTAPCSGADAQNRLRGAEAFLYVADLVLGEEVAPDEKWATARGGFGKPERHPSDPLVVKLGFPMLWFPVYPIAHEATPVLPAGRGPDRRGPTVRGPDRRGPAT